MSVILSTRQFKAEWLFCLKLWLGLAIVCPTLFAAEIHSNGEGGGKWSVKETWEEGRIPAADDVAVISMGDKVVFDRDDTQTISCAGLSLDPESIFELEAGVGKRVMRVNGSIESYGMIRLDGSLSQEDGLEIQFSGEADENFVLRRGASLTVQGFPNLPEGRKNVVIRRLVIDDAADDPRIAEFRAEMGCAVDIQSAVFQQVNIKFDNMNNTGIRINERLNILNNRFQDSSIGFSKCDSPRVIGNNFVGKRSMSTGIMFFQSPMAEVKDNRLQGFNTGIHVIYSELNLINSTIENVVTGILAARSTVTINNANIRHATANGIVYDHVQGSLQNAKIEDCEIGVRFKGSTLQINNTQFQLPDSETAKAIAIYDSSIKAINCNIDPAKVFVDKDHKEVRKYPLSLFVYVVVGVKGKIPPDGYVKIQLPDTKRSVPSDGTMEWSIVNSPAPILPNGHTPLPASQTALLVEWWVMDWAGKIGENRSYQAAIFTPAQGEKGKEKILKSFKLEPGIEWIRPNILDEKPTVEISL